MARTFAGATSALLLSLAAAGCGGSDDVKPPVVPPLLFYVTPKTAEVEAGSGAITFTGLLRGASGTIQWVLLGDLGSLSGPVSAFCSSSCASGPHVAYLPPASVATPTTLELRAYAEVGEEAWIDDSAIITVTPPASTLLVVTPGTACVVAGSSPTTFAARLDDASISAAWSLEPAGAGTLSTAIGADVEYTPPALVAAPTSVKVVATRAGATASAAVTVVSQAPCGPGAAAGSAEVTVTVDPAGDLPRPAVDASGAGCGP